MTNMSALFDPPEPHVGLLLAPAWAKLRKAAPAGNLLHAALFAAGVLCGVAIASGLLARTPPAKPEAVYEAMAPAEDAQAPGQDAARSATPEPSLVIEVIQPLDVAIEQAKSDLDAALREGSR